MKKITGPILFGLFLTLVVGIAMSVEVNRQTIDIDADTTGNLPASRVTGVATSTTTVTLVSTSAIQNTNSLQAGSTFYVASCSVDGQSLLARSSGNVGISTTAVTAKLTVGSGNIRVDNGRNFDWGDGSVNLEGDSILEYMRFVVGNAESMRIISGGNVGIASITPSNLLVVGAGAGTLNVQSGGNVGFMNLAPIYGIDASTTARITGEALLATTSGNVGVKTLAPAYGIDASTTMRVTGQTILATSSGNVGVSSSNPNSRLVVGNNADVFAVNSEGEVAIGTDSFTTQLHVLAPTGFSAAARFRMQGAADSVQIQGLSGGTNKWIIGAEGTGGGGNVITGSTANDAVLANSQSAPIRFGIADAIVASLTSNPYLRLAQHANCATATPGAVGDMCVQNSATQPVWFATATTVSGFQPLSLAAE